MEWHTARALSGRRGANVNTVQHLLAALAMALLSGLAGAAEPLVVQHNFFISPDSNTLSYKGLPGLRISMGTKERVHALDRVNTWDEREIFQLKNAYLPKETPLERRELWNSKAHGSSTNA